MAAELKFVKKKRKLSLSEWKERPFPHKTHTQYTHTYAYTYRPIFCKRGDLIYSKKIVECLAAHPGSLGSLLIFFPNDVGGGLSLGALPLCFEPSLSILQTFFSLA